MDDTIAALILFGLFVLFLVLTKPKKGKQRRSFNKSIKPKPIKQPVSTETITGGCWVIDGDTIHIGNHKIRFQGMNAPELDEPYGKQAKWALHKLVKGKTITAYPNGEKSYDRIVAK